MMMANGIRGSAQIYEFPAGGRTGAAQRRAEAAWAPAPAAHRGELVAGPMSWTPQPMVPVACGSSWYHDAAIEEALASVER